MEIVVHDAITSKKCKVISFVEHNHAIYFNYVLDSLPLVRVSEVEDLGISFSSDLTFTTI